MDERFNLKVPSTLAQACDPATTALLVYDMQVGIMQHIVERDRVIERVVATLDAARNAGIRTFFARHTTLPLELMGASQLRMWRSWQRRESVATVVSPFPSGSPQAQFIPELVPTDREAVVDKITMSAFEGTWLDIALRDCGITTVVVVGCAIEIGIEPTVRHAADLGYVPVVLTDACGSGNQVAGERSLATLQFIGDAILATADEFIDIL